jgi:hypothetical protein
MNLNEMGTVQGKLGIVEFICVLYLISNV